MLKENWNSDIRVFQSFFFVWKGSRSFCQIFLEMYIQIKPFSCTKRRLITKRKVVFMFCLFFVYNGGREANVLSRNAHKNNLCVIPPQWVGVWELILKLAGEH